MPKTRPLKSTRKERKVVIPEEITALDMTENIPVGTYVLLSPLRGPQRYTFLSKRCLEMTQTLEDLRAELNSLLPPLTAENFWKKSPAKNLSEHTIQSHRKRIAAKLGTQGSELLHAAFALRSPSLSSPKGK